MTPAELIALLRSDPASFNAWREAHPDAPVDLSGADLRGAELVGVLLAGANLDGARLDDATLEGAILSGASLRGASLLRADLRRAGFSFAALFNAKLSGTALGSALVRGADLSDADLRGARAEEASFKECALDGADFTDCNLEGAQLQRTALADPADRPPPPPPSGDFDGLVSMLQADAQAARDDVMRFAIFVHLTGAPDGAAQRTQLLGALAASLGYDQAGINGLMPRGEVRLEALPVTPPASHWVRRVVFKLMCAVAAAASSYPSTQLQLLGHFGEAYGMSDPAMARTMSEELGVEIDLA